MKEGYAEVMDISLSEFDPYLLGGKYEFITDKAYKKEIERIQS